MDFDPCEKTSNSECHKNSHIQTCKLLMALQLPYTGILAIWYLHEPWHIDATAHFQKAEYCGCMQMMKFCQNYTESFTLLSYVLLLHYYTNFYIYNNNNEWLFKFVNNAGYSMATASGANIDCCMVIIVHVGLWQSIMNVLQPWEFSSTSKVQFKCCIA